MPVGAALILGITTAVTTEVVGRAAEAMGGLALPIHLALPTQAAAVVAVEALPIFRVLAGLVWL